MAAIIDSQIVDSLRTQLHRIEAERDAQIETIRAQYQEQVDRLHRALEELTGEHTNGRPAVDQRPAITSLLSVGPDKIEMIRKELRKRRGWTRQADITKATGLNSGTISVGLRRLELSGQAQSGDKIDGSTTWKPVGKPASL